MQKIYIKPYTRLYNGFSKRYKLSLKANSKKLFLDYDWLQGILYQLLRRLFCYLKSRHLKNQVESFSHQLFDNSNNFMIDYTL